MDHKFITRSIQPALRMKVIFFDQTDKLRHGNTEPVESLQDLLAQSDIVSLHCASSVEPPM